MRFHLTCSALLAVALIAPNALADSGDDGEGIETTNAQGAWVPTSRESDDWTAASASAASASAGSASAGSASASGSSFAVMQPSDVPSDGAQSVGSETQTSPIAAPGAKSAVAASSAVGRENAKPESKTLAAQVHADDHAGASSDPHEGVLGVLRIGALAGVGAPSIFSGEGLAKIGDWVGLSGDYGVAPSLSVPIGNGGATISQTTVSAGARVFPFRGAFFVGGSVGQQTVSAKVTQTAEGVTGGASFSTKAMFVEPQIGLLYRFAFGLAIGCDAGVQIPVSASGQSSTSDNNVPLPSELSSAMKYAEKGVIPSLNLLRLGYVL